jgi:hypothetical protein
LSKHQENNSISPTTREGVFFLCGDALAELLQAVLSKGSLFRFQAKGFSMSPFIKDGDVVTVSPLFNAAPRLGDVLAFIHPGTKKIIIHRAVGKEGDSCIMRGDNCFDLDRPVPLTNVLGRVTRIDRDGKRILLGLGPERWLIALLTRRKLLFPLMVPVWRLVRPLIRWKVK